jgi:hypothetical protein
MFKITYKELRSPQFSQSLSKLAQCTELKPKTAYHIAKTATVLGRELSSSQKKWVAISKPLFKLNEAGTFIPNTTNEFFVTNEGVSEDDAKAKVEEFLNHEVLVERFKLKIDDLAPAKLSPQDLIALEPMLEAVVEE